MPAHQFCLRCHALLTATLLLFVLFPDRAICSGQETDQFHTPSWIKQEISNGGFVIRENNGAPYTFNADQHFIPASILKIVTAAAAQDILGKTYRFQTIFAQDDQGNLFIKGFGDPQLTSEELHDIMASLLQSGLKPIQNIIFDMRYFDLSEGQASGKGRSDNPYDAINAAVAVNYNTIMVKIGRDGSVVSAEPQTPNLPIMASLAKGQSLGKKRISISSSQKAAEAYAAQLIKAFELKLRKRPDSEKALWQWTERFQSGRGSFPEEAPLQIKHLSKKTINESIPQMLLYSNNFMANQIFLAIGAKTFGPPATWEKSRRAVSQFITTKIGLTEQSFSIIEGSGLSRQNRLSPKAMYTILEYFQSNADLLPLHDNLYLKSGTLQGVYCYAGYQPNQDQTLRPFVIMLNQKRNTRDRILKELIQPQ